MGTESTLGKVHVFPSEESYNTNKGSVGTNDLALVPIRTATTNEYGLTKLADDADLLLESKDKPMTVDNAYKLNDFRRMNKAYKVGDKVACAFEYEFYLECIQAGTTSTASLDTQNVTFGQEIEDGTAKWKVKTNARTVNGVEADEDGNVEIKSLPVTIIEANTDLNDITEFGEYVCQENSIVTTLTNCPIQQAFTLTVRKGASIQQELRHYVGKDGIWIRSYGDWNESWTTWERQGSDNDAIKQLVLDTFFPVGSIYMSVLADTAFNPNTAFGGTWKKIQNRFLYGAGSKAIGSTGGAETVTLTLEQMPTHSHARGGIQITGAIGDSANQVISGGTSGAFSSNRANVAKIARGASGTITNKLNFTGSSGWSGNSASQGNSKSHENMPPYIVVTIWKRTA